MFTGLIEKTAQVESIKRKNNIYLLCIKIFDTAVETKKGDSVSVNGVCLTAVSNKKGIICFEVMGKTFKNTNFSFLKKKDMVNIENALSLGEKIGGHFVQGHIDSMVGIKSIKKKPDGLEFTISLPAQSKPFIVSKGSVALDGISLTVQEVRKNTFTVYIISHTFKTTNLEKRKIGHKLNLEVDILAKYACPQNKSSSIDADFLKKSGF